MLWHIIATLALAIWFGGGIVAGFITPQAAFGVLEDRQLAGALAGMVLGRFSIMALVCGIVYGATWLGRLGSGRPFPRLALILTGIAILVVSYNHFILTPDIALLREAIRAGGETPELTGQFGRLHGTSVILFGIQWILAGSAFVVHVYRTFARH
jgi:ABC-type thiamin/hydroxymethylpyrimidine transport system permease subunit